MNIGILPNVSSILRNLDASSTLSEKFSRQPCEDFLKGICTKLPCDSWHPPACKFSISLNRVVNSAQSAYFRTGRLKNNQTKSRKKVKTKVQLLL